MSGYSTKYYYTYMSSDGDRFYIGYRSCDCHPFLDTSYFGSYRDKSFEPNTKEILAIFNNKSDALNFEIWLHKIYDVDKNPNFANQAKQTSKGFTTEGCEPWNKGKKRSQETIEKCRKAATGRKFSEETKKKLSILNSGKNNPMAGKFGKDHPAYGNKHTEETKRRIGEAAKLRKGHKQSEETKRKRSISKTDHTLYLWLNKNTNKKVICSKFELEKTFNLAGGHLTNLKNGKKWQYKGWICLCILP